MTPKPVRLDANGKIIVPFERTAVVLAFAGFFGYIILAIFDAHHTTPLWAVLYLITLLFVANLLYSLILWRRAEADKKDHRPEA